jgi:multicomponent Na+:H+ antiporter subunit E
MIMFAANLVLALIWYAATVRGGWNLIFGFAIGYAVLWWMSPILGKSRYFEKLPQLIRFTGFLAWQLVHSSLRVARDVVTRKTYRRPGIVAVPLDAKTDAEISVLALFISLTPGTLAIDVSDDRKVLYVHEMFITDPEEVRRQLKAGFERYVLALLR